MIKEIAVFLNNDGNTTTFNESGIIKVYTKKENEWEVIKEHKFSFENNINLKSIREEITSFIEAIEPCRVMVAKNVTGIPYNLLDKKGYNIWEMEGKPEDFLEYVLAKEVLEEMESTDNNTDTIESIPTRPMETDKDGCYYIDFKRLQEVNKNITSKQALIPFLQENKFYQLEIIFSHIPGWFDDEIKALNMKSEVLMLEQNKYKVTVWKKVCGEL